MTPEGRGTMTWRWGGSPEYDPLEADLGEREWGWGSGKQRGMEHIRGQQNTVFPRKQILLQRMPPPPPPPPQPPPRPPPRVARLGGTGPWGRFFNQKAYELETDAVNETGFTSFATHGTLGLL